MTTPDPAAPVAGTDVVEPHARTDALEAFYRLDEGLDDKLEKLLAEIVRLRAEVAELRAEIERLRNPATATSIRTKATEVLHERL